MVEIVWANIAEQSIAIGARAAMKFNQFLWSDNRDFRLAAGKFGVFLDGRGGTAVRLPVMWGICDAELSNTEVGECIQADYDSTEKQVEREPVRRKVFPLGWVDPVEKPADFVHAKINQTFHTGVEMFLYNPFAAAFTPSEIDVAGVNKIFGVWVR